MSHHIPASWDYGPRTSHPHDPRNDPDDGLQPCLECDGSGEMSGEPCLYCSGAGHFFDDEPMSASEYARMVSDGQQEKFNE